jgi:predicted transcriptional regulator
MELNEALLKAIKSDRIDSNKYKTDTIGKIVSIATGGLVYGGNKAFINGIAIMQFTDE